MSTNIGRQPSVIFFDEVDGILLARRGNDPSWVRWKGFQSVFFLTGKVRRIGNSEISFVRLVF